MKQKAYRTLNEIEAEYFTNNPEEISVYIQEILDEHSKDGNTEALRASLQNISKI